MSIRRLVTAFVALALVSTGCARLGTLQSGLGATLHSDLAHAGHGDREAAGAYGVDAEGIALQRFPIVLYRPRGLQGRAPAVVFLPGRFAPEQQYESYARALASHGIVVAMRGRYSWFHTDEALTSDGIELANWLRARPDVDASRIAIAGHSMGGRDAIRAAAGDPRFSAVVAIDPGTIEKLPNARAALAGLHVPLLLIGADEAWRGMEFCGRRGTNYAAYFQNAPLGTLELEIHGADHVQVMDHPDDLGYNVCRVGSANSTSVRVTSRTEVVDYLRGRLLGEHTQSGLTDYGRLATWRRRTTEEPAAAVASGSAGSTIRLPTTVPPVAAITGAVAQRNRTPQAR